ncbi:DUF885 family protein [Asticcacaulis excentricus]|uniref:DUF4168 domain-containing protein n=1 Tax=Asticcacaulis excentricus TaxID=78587 RepID=A0A3G9G324_9CAUL|nr:DUF885 family protein [Asticcacaulis excentricus]BBF81730.1 protein of unknown function DUF885 [Asticcacaulis excentricus]
MRVLKFLRFDLLGCVLCLPTAAFAKSLPIPPTYQAAQSADANMKADLKRGYTVPYVSTIGRDKTMEPYTRTDESNPLYDAFRDMPETIPAAAQALAYKIGELKMREMRALAEKELGADFDQRTFHDTILNMGSVPLTTFEREMRAHIAAEKTHVAAKTASGK